jgi:cytosine/adenosine deaminase-related metal-dependent hydrolase
LTLPGQVTAQVLVFEHATVIDATGAPPIADVSVLVRDGLISRIGPRISPGIEVPAGATVVDASGKFLIPGLWDMHVHLRDMEQSFRALLAYGITGVRDMYSGMAPRDYVRWRNTPISVRMVVAGMVDAPEAGNEEETRTAVKLLAANGAEFIVPGKRLSREAYFALAAECRRIGAAFAGEVPDAVTPEEAAIEGQLSLEYVRDVPAAVFETFVDRGTWVTPVLVSGRTDPRIVAEMHRAGVSFLAGTDSAEPLGASLHRELELLVASGFTPMEALQTATRNPAFYFGTLPLMGTLEEGKVADIVILDANPLDDIRNTRKIDAVVMRGMYFPRPALDALTAAN